MKAFVVVLVLILIAGAYLGGYWPEHSRLLESQRNLQAVSAQLAEAQARLRLFGLHHRLLHLIDTVTEKNYGEAQKLSTDFFDEVRAEIMRTDKAELKSALESVLQARDSMTAGLAKADPGVVNVLDELKKQIGRFLEHHSPPGASPPAASAAPEPTG